MPARTPSITVLGGYGRVGRLVCGLLAGEGIGVVVAGRSVHRGEQLAAELRATYPGVPVTARGADGGDPVSVQRALEGARALVVAAPLGVLSAPLASACVDASCDYLDIAPAPAIPPALAALSARAERSGRLLVTQGGLCPGLPSALVRAAGRRLDRCRAARVGIALSLRTCAAPRQAYEIVDAAVDYRPRLFRRGQWRTASRRKARLQMDYGPGFGERVGLPLDLPELHGVEEELGLQELAAFGATPAWRIDVMGRATLGALYRVRRGLGRHTAATLLLLMARRAPAAAGASIVAVVDGERHGRAERGSIAVRHADAAELTAIAVVAFLRRYAAGAYRERAGVRMMGHLFDERALGDMQRLGARVEIATGEPWDLRG